MRIAQKPLTLEEFLACERSQPAHYEFDGVQPEPIVVREVLSPSTALTDRRVKAWEYAAVPGILVYVLLEQDRPEITVMRRSGGWEPEVITGTAATLELPETSTSIPLNAIYAT
jgi:Uma2 family endonuclease